MSSLNRRSFVAIAAAASIAGPRVSAAQNATPDAPLSTFGDREVTHVGGTTILSGDPQRVVALEWSLVEHALALGIQPIGVADVEGYRSLVTIPLELNDDAADVGTRQEPSVEAIAALEPDLILAIDWRHEAIYDQLADIAPTILVPFDVRGDDITPLENIADRVTLLGQALNQPDAAAAVLEQMQATLDAESERVDEAGLTGQPFIFAFWYTDTNQPTMRLFLDEHIVGQTISSLGLVNAWIPDEIESSGFSTVGYEALAALPEDVHFVFVPTPDGGWEEQLESDPIVSSLPFVQDGRAYPLAPDTWTNPGALGVEVLATRVVDALTGSASEA